MAGTNKKKILQNQRCDKGRFLKGNSAALRWTEERVRIKMAKSRTSGAVVKNGVDTTGLTFKRIPSSTKAKVENSKNIRQALRNGQTLVLRNDDTGNVESYKLNRKDMTFTVTNRKETKTVSYEDGGNSWASWLLSKNRSYALR